MYGLCIVPTEQICIMPWTCGNLSLLEGLIPRARKQCYVGLGRKNDLPCSMTKVSTRASLVDMPNMY